MGATLAEPFSGRRTLKGSGGETVERSIGVYCERDVCVQVLQEMRYRASDEGSELRTVKTESGRRTHVMVEGSGDIVPGNPINVHFDFRGISIGPRLYHHTVKQDPTLQSELHQVCSKMAKAMKAVRKARRQQC